MSLFNLFNKKHTIVYTKHPRRAGHAVLADTAQLPLVQKYGFSNTVNSHEFEALSQKASQDKVEVLWHA